MSYDNRKHKYDSLYGSSQKTNLSEGCNKELIYLLSVNSIKNEKQIPNLIIKRLKVRSNSH